MSRLLKLKLRTTDCDMHVTHERTSIHSYELNEVKSAFWQIMGQGHLARLAQQAAALVQAVGGRVAMAAMVEVVRVVASHDPVPPCCLTQCCRQTPLAAGLHRCSTDSIVQRHPSRSS
jgi:hypothetical protein